MIVVILGALTVALCVINCVLCTDYAHPIGQTTVVHHEDTENSKRPNDHMIITPHRNSAQLVPLRVPLDAATETMRQPCCCGCHRRHDRCIPSTISASTREKIFYTNIFFVVFLAVCIVLLISFEVSLNRAVNRSPQLVGDVAAFLDPKLTTEVSTLTDALVTILDRVSTASTAVTQCHAVSAITSAQNTQVINSLNAVSNSTHFAIAEVDTASINAQVQRDVATATAGLTTASAEVVGSLSAMALSVLSARDTVDASAQKAQETVSVLAWSVFGVYLTIGFVGVCISWADGMYAKLRRRCEPTPLFGGHPKLIMHCLSGTS